MTAGVELWPLVAIALALLLGATVQSVVGLGLGLVAAPVTALVAPQLMPGLLISLAMVLPCLTLVAEHHDIDWRGLAWSLPSRVLGTVVGVWTVAHFSDRALGVAVGTMVLAAVLLSWRAFAVPVTPGTLTTAGFISGVTGTATSIGGPPFALLYQHRPPAQIRSTLAVYFIIGAGLSVTGLVASGELTADEARLAVLFAPLLGLGALLGAPVRRRVSPAVIRPAVLVVCALSALLLLVRSLAG